MHFTFKLWPRNPLRVQSHHRVLMYDSDTWVKTCCLNLFEKWKYYRRCFAYTNDNGFGRLYMNCFNVSLGFNVSFDSIELSLWKVEMDWRREMDGPYRNCKTSDASGSWWAKTAKAEMSGRYGEWHLEDFKARRRFQRDVQGSMAWRPGLQGSMAWRSSASQVPPGL